MKTALALLLLALLLTTEGPRNGIWHAGVFFAGVALVSGIVLDTLDALTVLARRRR